MRIMMSAAGSAVAPGIIRHLQMLGHYVIGHDRNEHGAGHAIADEFYRSPGVNSSMYLSFLQKHQQCDLYLPFLDEEIGKPWFNSAVKYFSVTGDMRLMTSKIKQHCAFENRRLPTPGWSNSGDTIAKPEFGRGSKGLFRTSNEIILQELADSGFYTEKFIDGDEYTIDVLADLDGKFLYAVPRLRVEANGVSIIGRIDMDMEIIDLAKQVVNAFQFRGPINVQVIREHKTGKLYLIEVNPRLSGSCMFTVMAGFDILDATIRLHEGKPFIPPAKVEEIMVRRYYVEERM